MRWRRLGSAWCPPLRLWCPLPRSWPPHYTPSLIEKITKHFFVSDCNGLFNLFPLNTFRACAYRCFMETAPLSARRGRGFVLSPPRLLATTATVRPFHPTSAPSHRPHASETPTPGRLCTTDRRRHTRYHLLHAVRLTVPSPAPYPLRTDKQRWSGRVGGN
jgi:hypothetical protein